MSKIPYTSCVLRYVHDPVAKESLNIGVMVYAPGLDYLQVLVEPHYARLSQAFSGFDGEHYRRVVRNFRAALETIKDEFAQEKRGLFTIETPQDRDAAAVARMIWPDQGLSFRVDSAGSGLTENPDRTLERLFALLVSSQYLEEREERRSDDDVWSGAFRRPLAERDISRVLETKTVKTPDAEFEFPHAFKNGAWHILQPISMDFVRREQLQRKANYWLGNAFVLRESSEIAKLYILLGAPTHPEHRDAYEKAKRLLERMPVNHELVEEDRAADFADWLATYMREHGVVDQATEGEIAESEGGLREVDVSGESLSETVD
jgi:hypothetical protein